MARYKKRPTIQPGMPGLFDDFDDSLFTSADDFPVHPAIERGGGKTSRRRKGETGKECCSTTATHSRRLKHSPTIDRLKFISLGSGSSGNCAYFGDDTSGFLIDAGVDMVHVVDELHRNGVDMKNGEGDSPYTRPQSDHVRGPPTPLSAQIPPTCRCSAMPRALNGPLRRHAISNRIRDYHHATPPRSTRSPSATSRCWRSRMHPPG